MLKTSLIGQDLKFLVGKLHFMWKRLVLLILFGLLVCRGFAQEQYRAVFSGGRVYLSQDNKYTQLQSGQLINPESQIELVGNAQVVLMDHVGRLLSLTLSGKYELAKLDQDQSGDSSLFVKSVWETYYASRSESIADKLQIGSGSQSVFSPFELWLPSSSQFYSNKLIIPWAAGKEPYYSAELINEFGEVFETRQTEQPFLELNMVDNPLVWKDEITLRIKQPGSGAVTADCTLDRLSPPEYEKLDRLVKEHFQDDDFGMMLTKAAFFENQWLFADALTILTELRNQHGALMQNFWQQYLRRNGFDYTSR